MIEYKKRKKTQEEYVKVLRLPKIFSNERKKNLTRQSEEKSQEKDTKNVG